MSIHSEVKRVTTQVLLDMKSAGEKISMLTGYDFSMARIIDGAGVDIILVGDSASNVMAGHETTLPITLDQMIYHASSVIRAVKRAFVVVDLPFGSYQGDSKIALKSTIRIMKESGAHGVKIGLAGEMKIVDMFGLQTGLYFDQSGSKLKDILIVDTKGNISHASARYDFNRITLPVTAEIYLGDPRHLRFMAGVGPMVSFLVSGKRNLDSKDASFPADLKGESKINFQDEGISAVDLSLGLNIGFITRNGLFFRVNATKGLKKNTILQFQTADWHQVHMGASVGFLL